MDIVRTLLIKLDNNGIGNPMPISDILKEIFFEPESFNSTDEYFAFAGRVENFLSELQKAGLINYRKDGFYRSTFAGHCHMLTEAKFYASITYNGSKSLTQDFDTNRNSIVINAPFSGNLNQGDNGNINQNLNVPDEESKQLTSKLLEDLPKAKRNRIWVIILAIIAIIVAIAIGIYQKT